MENKIVITDPIYLTDEQLSRLESLGSVIKYDSMPESEKDLVNRLSDANIAIIGFAEFPEAVISHLDNLKMISIWATGYDYVDVKYAAKRGVVACNVPSYAANAVAEYVLSSVLMLERKVCQAISSVESGRFTWKPFQGHEISQKTIGIIGFGSIGRKLAQLCSAFGMNVLAYTAHPESKNAENVSFVGLNELLSNSDYVSIHTPLNNQTEMMINKEKIMLMKSGSVLINTARGKVIDESYLAQALNDNKIRAAILDVLSVESDFGLKNNPLYGLKNAIITPHIAFHTQEALSRCTDMAIDNIQGYLSGNIINQVNSPDISNVLPSGF